MKYLLVLVVVFVAFFIWRNNRRDDVRRTTKKQRPAIDMAACDRCGVHCPTADMVVGRQGSYCSAQHRDQAET